MTSQDKSKELRAKVILINDKLNFSGISEGNAAVSIDYFPPLGDNLGYTSLELFLLSLTSCIGSSLLVFLRKMQKTITSFEMYSTGVRNEDHPTGFKEIYVDIRLKSPDVKNEDMNKVIILSEEKYCPVWSMIKGNVIVNTEFRIINSDH